MALSAAEALSRSVAQTVSVTIAAVAINTYAAADGTPAAVTADGSSAANTVELARTSSGTIYGIRGNAGVVLSKRVFATPSDVFEFLFEGIGGTNDTEVGGPEF